MNIRSVKTEVVPQPLDTIASKTSQQQPPASAQAATAEDSFNPAQNAKLVNMLQQQPDIRPEALQRAQQLASDPNYPDNATLSKLASLFVSDSEQD